jgi:hypothetical protein
MKERLNYFDGYYADYQLEGGGKFLKHPDGFIEK